MGFFIKGYAMTRRQVQDEIAYLITEASEDAFSRAERSGRFDELMRLVEQGQSEVKVPVMTTWIQPQMWGLAAK